MEVIGCNWCSWQSPFFRSSRSLPWISTVEFASLIARHDASAEVTQLRITVLWVVLATGAGVFAAMLIALRHHRAHVTTSTQPRAAAEYVWTVVPWLILALGAGPALHRVLAAGEGDVCMSCHLAVVMAQPPPYPPFTTNKCIGTQSAGDPIRTAFKCGYSPQTVARSSLAP